MVSIHESPISSVNLLFQFPCHPIQIFHALSLNMRFERLSPKYHKIFGKRRILSRALPVILRRLHSHQNHLRKKMTVVPIILFKPQALRPPERLLITEYILTVIHIQYRITLLTCLIPIRQKHPHTHLSIQRGNLCLYHVNSHIVTSPLLKILSPHPGSLKSSSASPVT